jgi:hypothetical protein
MSALPFDSLVAHGGTTRYLGLNVLCGTIWSPFTHLSSCVNSLIFPQDPFLTQLTFRNIIQHRYDLTESDAATQASYLLAGSIVLYPIVRLQATVTRRLQTHISQCGYLVDRFKHRPIALQLFMVSSCLSLSCYIWLALPPQWTRTAIPAIIAFATAIGSAQCKSSNSYCVYLLNFL